MLLLSSLPPPSLWFALIPQRNKQWYDLKTQWIAFNKISFHFISLDLHCISYNNNNNNCHVWFFFAIVKLHLLCTIARMSYKQTQSKNKKANQVNECNRSDNKRTISVVDTTQIQWILCNFCIIILDLGICSCGMFDIMLNEHVTCSVVIEWNEFHVFLSFSILFSHFFPHRHFALVYFRFKS